MGRVSAHGDRHRSAPARFDEDLNVHVFGLGLLRNRSYDLIAAGVPDVGQVAAEVLPQRPPGGFPQARAGRPVLYPVTVDQGQEGIEGGVVILCRGTSEELIEKLGKLTEL